MKVLVVHNRYRSDTPSGENRVVDHEVGMLRDAGVEVETYFRDSDEIATFGAMRKAELAVRPIFSLEDTIAFRRMIRQFKPDVVHLHNPFPLISPWVVREAKRAGLPVVQTVHNYRHLCVAGSLFRAGKPCHDCSGRPLGWPAIIHGCYRNSRAQSAVMAVAQAAHRPTWQVVDRFLAVSQFVASRLCDAGIPRNRITVRPGTVAAHAPAPIANSAVLFAGRLEAPKGIRLLLAAWDSSQVRLRLPLLIAGAGPDHDLVQHAAARSSGITYLGQLSADDMPAAIVSASVIAVPSLVADACPLTAIEALGRGRPVLATNVGGLPEIIDSSVGWVVEPTVPSISAALQDAAFGGQTAKKGAAASLRYETCYGPRVMLASLLEAYRDAVEHTRSEDRVLGLISVDD